MYVGSTTSRPDPNQYVPSTGKDGTLRMRRSPKEIDNTPAFVKVFDEVRKGKRNK